jgi:hypothetical protein
MYFRQYHNTLAASTQIKEIFRNADTFQILFLSKKEFIFFHIYIYLFIYLFIFVKEHLKNPLLKHSGFYLIIQNESFKFN